MRPRFIYFSNQLHRTLKGSCARGRIVSSEESAAVSCSLKEAFNILLTFYCFIVPCLWMNCPFKSHPAHPGGTQPQSMSSRCCKTCQNVLPLNSLTLPAANMGPVLCRAFQFLLLFALPLPFFIFVSLFHLF